MTTIINASTSSGLIQTADTSGILALQSGGTTQFTVDSTGAYGQLESRAVVAASSTSVDFTSVPSWVKRITLMLSGISTSGTSAILIQLGDSGGVEVTGYLGAGSYISASPSSVSYTAGFGILSILAANVVHGAVTISLIDSATNTWVASGALSLSNNNVGLTTSGTKPLSATLDRVRLTTANGTDTFDAGSINILYEG